MNNKVFLSTVALIGFSSVVSGLFLTDVIDYTYVDPQQEREQLNSRAWDALHQEPELDVKLEAILGTKGYNLASSNNCLADIVNVYAYSDNWDNQWCHDYYSHVITKLKSDMR